MGNNYYDKADRKVLTATAPSGHGTVEGTKVLAYAVERPVPEISKWFYIPFFFFFFLYECI